MGRLLGSAVILLSLPAGILVAVIVADRIWHPVVLRGAQTQPHSIAAPIPEWQAAVAFVFWLDAGLVGRYGLLVCLVSSAMWLLLWVFGKGLSTKIISFIFLAPSIAFVLAER